MEEKKKFCSILVKIRWAFLTLFAVFLLIISYIVIVQYKARSLEDIYNQNKYEDELLSQSLEAKIQNINSSVNMIIIHLNKVTTSENWVQTGGPSIQKEIQRLIYRCMIDTFTTFHDAEQVMVVWNNGVTWYENWTENYSMQYGGEPLAKELEELGVNKNGNWLTKISSESPIKGTGCYYAKQYVDIESGQKLGYVVLKVKNILESVGKKDMQRDVYLFDALGHLVQSSDEKAIQTRDEYQEAEERLGYSIELKQELLKMKSNEKQIVHSSEFGSGWEIVSVTDISLKMKSVNQSILSILAASLSLMIVIYVVTFQIIKRILNPIQKLSAHMVEFKGKLPAPIDIPTQNDEIGVLIVHFNKMAKRNAELVTMLLKEENEQEQLKLSLLQSQIKPHFLYNALDTIYCLVVMGKNEEGSRMTKLLSMYYRHVLSRGMDWVLLSEEVQQTENYLQIQKIRYRDLLEFQIEVDESIQNIKMPKLTLQPLVENAIYHGIKPTGRKGNLKIAISQKQKMIYIRVKDDGMGFSQERFEECVAADHCTEGFGLKNVVDRLKIYYKESVQVCLEPCDRGSCLLIRLDIGDG